MSVRKRKINISYDKDHDVLYVSLGAPKPSYCDTDIEGILIRRAMDNNRLSGITIMDFSRKTREQLKRTIPFKVDINQLYEYSQP